MARENTISTSASRQTRRLTAGSLQGFIGSAISLPTGIITAAFLTRKLGAEYYGLLTVAATIVGLIEISITTGFCRTAEKYVSTSASWRPAATRFLQAQLLLGIVAATALGLSAPLLSDLLNAPKLAFFLSIYAVGIPISALGTIHQSILVGRQFYGKRAILLGIYWIFRLLLIVLLVSYSATVEMVIAANIGASAFTLVLSRRFINPPWTGRSDFPTRKLWDYAWPLFFYTVGLQLFRLLDLMMVTAMCPDPAAAGYFGATKNLTIIPSLVALSFSPLLLAELSRLDKAGDIHSAHRMIETSLRMMLCLFPFAALAAGSASEIAILIYGEAFSPAGPFLALLIFGASAMAVFTVAVSIFVSGGRPEIPFYLIAPALPAAILFHMLSIPAFGATGAAFVTTCLSIIVATASLFTIKHVRQAHPPVATILKIAVLSVLAYWLSAHWPANGVRLIAKLLVSSIGIFTAIAVSGLFSPGELQTLKSFLPYTGNEPLERNIPNG